MADINLSQQLENSISPQAIAVMRSAMRLAQERHQNLYLVGGAVRDLLLERPVIDIDLVLEGSALDMACQIAAETGCTAILHTEFLTAKLSCPSCNIDLASARGERYPHHGALPIVHLSDISTDMQRRDFSINAMAVSLCEETYGQLLDEQGGLSDLRNQLIRVLHKHSFQDDATRMWRAIKYEQRLDFRMENNTEILLRQDLPMLSSISGERLWYELECIFGELQPEKALRRAAELGLLRFIHPQLCRGSHLSEWYNHARQVSLPHSPEIGLYLALLLHFLDAAGYNKVAELLKLNKNLSRILQDSYQIKTCVTILDYNNLLPSFIHHTLHPYDVLAIKATLITTTAPNVKRNIQFYLEKLRYVNSILNGNDLLALGIKQGPHISTLLNCLLDARLDGKISSREDEIQLIKLLN